MARGAGIAGEAGDGPSRPVVFGIAALVTAFGVAGALYLGAWAYGTRSRLIHERRLARLLTHAPTLKQVDQAFRDEGTQPLGAADDPSAWRALALRLAGEKAGAVLAAGRAHARTRAYAAGDTIYFIHYDAAGVMRGYTLVSR